MNAELRDAQDRWPRFAPRAVGGRLPRSARLPAPAPQEVIGAIGVFGTTAASGRRRRPHRADAGPRRHDRAAAGARRPPRGRALRTAAVGAEQPDRHRAGQGRRRPVPRRHRGRGVRDPAAMPDVPAPTWSRWRSRHSPTRRTSRPCPTRCRTRPTGRSTAGAARRAAAEGSEARTWRRCWARRRPRQRGGAPGPGRGGASGPGAEDQSRLDRIWAGRDRDSSMVDRADLMDLLNEGGRAHRPTSRPFGASGTAGRKTLPRSAAVAVRCQGGNRSCRECRGVTDARRDVRRGGDGCPAGPVGGPRRALRRPRAAAPAACSTARRGSS